MKLIQLSNGLMWLMIVLAAIAALLAQSVLVFIMIVPTIVTLYIITRIFKKGVPKR